MGAFVVVAAYPGCRQEAEKMIETFEQKRIEQEEASLSTFNKNLKKAIDYDPKKINQQTKKE